MLFYHKTSFLSMLLVVFITKKDVFQRPLGVLGCADKLRGFGWCLFNTVLKQNKHFCEMVLMFWKVSVQHGFKIKSQFKLHKFW